MVKATRRKALQPAVWAGVQPEKMKSPTASPQSKRSLYYAVSARRSTHPRSGPVSAPSLLKKSNRPWDLFCTWLGNGAEKHIKENFNDFLQEIMLRFRGQVN